MIEPPQPGFTGVVWEAREPDRLTRELSTGPGAVPMAEAGAAWGRLAASLGAAVLEYEQIMAGMRDAWQSQTSNAVMERVSMLRDWLTDASAAAGRNAVHAEAQAASYHLARLAMPNPADIAAIQQMQKTLEAVGAALGAPIKAVAAQTDTEADAAKAAASRVMRTYEAATEPLALPWEQQQPPKIAPVAPLEGEQAGKEATLRPASGSLPAITPGMFMPSGMLGSMSTRTPGAYRAPVFAQTAAVAETAVPQAVPTTQPAGSVPMVPPGTMGAGAAAAEEEEHQPRAGDAGDALGPELGIVSAPAVLGAPDPQHGAPQSGAAQSGQTAMGGAA